MSRENQSLTMDVAKHTGGRSLKAYQVLWRRQSVAQAQQQKAHV